MKIQKHKILANKKIDIIKRREETQVYYDQNLIELILRNLLENAGKYSPESEKIIVKYKSTKEGLEISCQDFGIGIPKEDQEPIFESFKRGSNTEEIKGTVLGLPIVKKAVTKMGGTEINKGSTFIVNLPNQKERK